MAMEMRRNRKIGVAAAALAVSACGLAISNSGGASGGHLAPVSARHAPAATPITDQEMFARVKRHLIPRAGDPGVLRPQAGTSSVNYQDDLARLKRYMASHAGQARSR
jgi:hypothetical protein